ncbi:MAG: cation transporter [Desulfobacteraceae bacterium]|nr:MAG: cation transporter [Desulfobacteraceae bacterium]
MDKIVSGMVEKDMAGEAARGKSVTIVGALVNIVMIALKFITGFLGQSSALIADAVHSVSDLVTDVIVLFGLWIGRKPPDDKHHFGHARVETIASVAVGAALIATAVYIGLQASMDIYHHRENHPTGLALIGAGLSIVFKEILYRYTVHVGRTINSQLVVANAWHHRSDALSSVAVFLGVGGTMIHPSWHLLDAFSALLVSFFIVKVGLEIIAESFSELTDAAPSREVIQKIETCALSVDQVKTTHDLRVRSTGGRYQVEIHIVIDGMLSVLKGHAIAKKVEHCIKEDVTNVDRIIVHVDPEE